MSTIRSTWWSVTAFNEDIERCEGVLPWFIKNIYGGREECPKTKTIHFQGAIQCQDQVRMSAVKHWLPKAHLEPARQKEALKKYAMKKDTAVGEKLVRSNIIPYLSADEICLLLARQTDKPDAGFWPRAKQILLDRPYLAGQLMNPSLRSFYEKTSSVWLQKIAIVLQQSTCNCRKDNCEACSEVDFISHISP